MLYGPVIIKLDLHDWANRVWTFNKTVILIHLRFFRSILFLGYIHADDSNEHRNMESVKVCYKLQDTLYCCNINKTISNYFSLHIIWFLLIRGNPANDKRYRNTMILGYACPSTIVVVTAITELVAPDCAPFKPRFGEDGCFFAGEKKTDRFCMCNVIRYIRLRQFHL